MKPCRHGHVAPRDQYRRCTECRRIADSVRKGKRNANRLDPNRRGKCSACQRDHRALNAHGRCAQGCEVGKRRRGEDLARMQVLQDHILTLTDRLWQSSMSWDRNDIRNEIAQAQQELRMLAMDATHPSHR